MSLRHSRGSFPPPRREGGGSRTEQLLSFTPEELGSGRLAALEIGVRGPREVRAAPEEAVRALNEAKRALKYQEDNESQVSENEHLKIVVDSLKALRQLPANWAPGGGRHDIEIAFLRLKRLEKSLEEEGAFLETDALESQFSSDQ